MTFLLNRKLRHWVDANLITEETAMKIQDFENKGSGTNVTYAALGIGALSIVIGIISVIAANWYLIPDWLKLASNISWLCALICAIVWTVKNKKSFAREVLALIYFGSILGSIALVGQIYHLSSHEFYALSYWMVLGSPLVLLLCESKYAAWIWAFCLGQWAFQGQQWLYSEYIYRDEVPFFLFAYLYIGGLISLTKLQNRTFSEAVLRISGLFSAGTLMIAGSIYWASNHTSMDQIKVLINFALSLPVVFFVGRKFNYHLALILFGWLLFALVPEFFKHGDISLIGAILFIALMISVAHFAVKNHLKKIFESACLFIALRIIIIYFEVFGSLLQTGIGLILSGVFIIFIVWLWNSQRRFFWRKS